MNELVFLFMRVEPLLAFQLLMLTSGILFSNNDSLAEPALISQIASKLEPNYLENNNMKSTMQWVQGYKEAACHRQR